MNDIRAKVAYLHGLAEGLDLDSGTAEGRVLSSMLDVISEMAEKLTDVADAHDDLAAYVDDLDYDLGSLEETLFGDEDEEGAEVFHFLPDADVRQEEDGVDLIACPTCGESLSAEGGEVEGTLDVLCPVCGCSLIEGDLEYEDGLSMEHD